MPSSLKRSRSADRSFERPTKRLRCDKKPATSPDLLTAERTNQPSLASGDNWCLENRPKKRKFGEIDDLSSGLCETSVSVGDVCDVSAHTNVIQSQTHIDIYTDSQQLQNNPNPQDSYTNNHSSVNRLGSEYSTYHQIGCLESTHKRQKLDLPGVNIQTLTPVMSDLDPTFNSFNYWKPLLPEIDAELMAFVDQSSMEAESSPDIQEDCTAFNSFNFWRAPIPVLDMDIDFDNL